MCLSISVRLSVVFCVGQIKTDDEISNCGTTIDWLVEANNNTNFLAQAEGVSNNLCNTVA